MIRSQSRIPPALPIASAAKAKADAKEDSAPWDWATAAAKYVAFLDRFAGQSLSPHEWETLFIDWIESDVPAKSSSIMLRVRQQFLRDWSSVVAHRCNALAVCRELIAVEPASGPKKIIERVQAATALIAFYPAAKQPTNGRGRKKKDKPDSKKESKAKA